MTTTTADAAKLATASTVERERPANAVESIDSGLAPPQFLGAKTHPRWRSIAVRAAVPLVLFATWWIITATKTVGSDELASPSQVWGAFTELIDTGQLTSFLAASLVRLAEGIAIGSFVGLFLGTLSGLFRPAEELIDPVMQMQRAVPFLALIPLLIVWFGVGETFRVGLIAIASGAPMYAYTYTGVRNVDRKVVEAARSFGLRGPRLVSQVVLPSALPSILMALRVCMGISLTGLIAAEQVGTTKGIGYLVYLSQQYYRMDYMVLCIILYALLGLVIDFAIRGVERALMPWHHLVAVR